MTGAKTSEPVSDEQAFLAGRRAWPLVSLPRERFSARFRRLPQAPLASSALSGDLFLAFACAEGIETALAEFERTILVPLGAQLGRFKLSRAELDELRQELRVRLFVGESPRIAAYEGRGPLAGWVRIAAIRMALNMRARPDQRSAANRPLPASLVATQAAPDVQLQTAVHVPALQAAIEEALRSLSDRDKVILQMHILDGVALQELADMHRVHRATVARWLVDARTRVLELVRQRVPVGQRAASPSELRSLFAAVRSEVDLSLRRLFAGTVSAIDDSGLNR